MHRTQTRSPTETHSLAGRQAPFEPTHAVSRSLGGRCQASIGPQTTAPQRPFHSLGGRRRLNLPTLSLAHWAAGAARAHDAAGVDVGPIHGPAGHSRCRRPTHPSQTALSGAPSGPPLTHRPMTLTALQSLSTTYIRKTLQVPFPPLAAPPHTRTPDPAHGPFQRQPCRLAVHTRARHAERAHSLVKKACAWTQGGERCERGVRAGVCRTSRLCGRMDMSEGVKAHERVRARHCVCDRRPSERCKREARA